MERISIFNYEAFYLDYLEGQLGEEDTAMLMAFLEEHPECRMEEEEDLPIVSSETFSFEGKERLKQVDESGAIHADNLDHFLIAEAEGQLTPEKQEELNSFVSGHAEREAERKRYALTYFTADTSVVYGDKAGLKRKKAIVLWPYASFAAAAAILAFIFLWDGDRVVESGVGQPTQVANESTSKVTVQASGTSEGTTSNESQERVVDPNGLPVYTASQESNSGSTTGTTVDNNPQQRPSFKQTSLDRVPVKNVLAQSGQSHLRLVEGSSLPPLEQQPTTEQPEPYLGVSNVEQMTNPIEPITQFISEKTKTEVDFRRSQKKEEGRKGFFVKIGKLEIAKK